MTLLNPYIAGNPVGGGDAFIGRSDILREVLRTLRNPNEDALLLYGQRRIGKTSVLQELKERLPNEGNYFPVYFDLQDQASLPFKTLLTGLSRCICEELGIDLPQLNIETIETDFKSTFLKNVIEQLPKKSSVILLFDEFDVLDHPQKDQSSAAFFPYLRQLLSNFNQRLQFVFVIGRRPDDLTNITTSLFKSTRSYPVSLLSREDSSQLVRLSEKNKSLEWSDEAVNKVCDLAGGHPFLTQQLCQEVWEQSYQDDHTAILTITEEDVDQAVPSTLSGARQALEWLWNGLNPAERVVAAALAEAGRKPISQVELENVLQKSGVRILIGELQNAPKVLEDWDLIQENEEGFEFRVELLRQWIADRKPLSREQEEIDKIQPLAESFFQTAYGVYSAGELDEAVRLLEKSISFNPNHFKASQLLGEIFIAQGKIDDSINILEKLYKYQPSVAKPRLVQALLLQASSSVHSTKHSLSVYRKVLKIEPRQSEAVLEYQEILAKKVEECSSLTKVDELLELFLEGTCLFKCTDDEEVNSRLIQNAGIVIDKLLLLNKFPSASSFVSELRAHSKYICLEAYMEKIEKGLTLEEDYNAAIDSFVNNDYDRAAQKFSEIVHVNKNYKSAAYYLLLSTEIDNSFSMVSNKLRLIYKKALVDANVDEQKINRLMKVRPQTLSSSIDDVEQYTERDMTSSNDSFSPSEEAVLGVIILGMIVIIFGMIVMAMSRALMFLSNLFGASA